MSRRATLTVWIWLGCLTPAYAFHWHDLWQTRDHQAQVMMNSGQYAAAQKTFERDDWRATAAFRASDYQQAAALYARSSQADAYYNAGNALAHLGRYEQAIHAYNNALERDKTNQDAVHNRRMIEELLKQQAKQNQDKQNQGKQNQDPDARQRPMPRSSSERSSHLDKSMNPADNTPRSVESSERPDQLHQAKQTQQFNPSKADRYQQHATDQWLRLIPDDPGGLLREKFLRDYLRRRGELQP